MLKRWLILASLLGAALGASLLAAPPAAHAEEQRYAIRASMEEMEVNSRGTLTLEVEAVGGFAIDAAYPAALSVLPEVGDEVLVAQKQKYERRDAKLSKDGKTLSWAVSFTGRRAGKHPVKLNAKFRVCKDDECHEEEASLRLTVVVKG
ncbi:MAG: hypothetical protein KC731_26565 [Myxococcales bacterium]|nr:hypothetical protein [Myxococcales bacterium]